MAKTDAPAEDKQTTARNKNLDLAIQQIEKDYGTGAIMRLGSKTSMEVEVIPSGNILIDRALEKGIIEKRGSWMSYKGNQLAQGRDAAKEVLKADAALFDEIEAAVKAKMDEVV